jgi:small subunit ribosomal protein S9
MVPGTGVITINGKNFDQYFPTPLRQYVLNQALEVTNSIGQFDIRVNVHGGGVTGQAEAIRLAIARALVKNDDSVKPALKTEGFLTRNPKMVERKKFGHKKARKSFQFSKR